MSGEGWPRPDRNSWRNALTAAPTGARPTRRSRRCRCTRRTCCPTTTSSWSPTATARPRSIPRAGSTWPRSPWAASWPTRCCWTGRSGAAGSGGVRVAKSSSSWDRWMCWMPRPKLRWSGRPRRSAASWRCRCGSVPDSGQHSQLVRGAAGLTGGAEIDGEGAARAQLRAYGQGAVHQRQQAAGKRQAQAGALVAAARAGVDLHELLEDQLLVLRRDPDAGVGDLDVHRALAWHHADVDLALGRRELDGVGEQVEHDLEQPAPI